MYMPFEAACVLIRNFEEHLNTFSTSAHYLTHMTRGLAGGQYPWFGDLGLQLTRNFRALKVWMTLKAYGLDKFTRLVEQNVSQAYYLADLVESDPHLELLADVPLNIICFRFVASDKSDQELDDINLEIMLRLHERGLAIPSYTSLNGKFALRVAITNHRSRREDFDFLVAKVKEIAQEVIES
jgi:glutamate/tyrosine decarboxylase-like PLP-dependent enzyme